MAVPLFEALWARKLAATFGEARRMARCGLVKVNGDVQFDEAWPVEPGDSLDVLPFPPGPDADVVERVA